MQASEYYAAVQRVAELVEQKQDYAAAVAVLESLIHSDLPDMDRSIMCVNMAVVCDRMGHETHALAWYDHGMALEEPHMRSFAAVKKAEYLWGKGKKQEAIAIYQRLLELPFHTTPEREQFRQNIARLSA